MATIVAGNTTYNYDVLKVAFENQLNTKLSFAPFYTTDNSLVGVAGDKVRINKYTATDGTETLAVGEGNSKAITVSFAEEDYTIKLLQNKFAWNDEQAMKDPNILIKGQQHMVDDMLNTVNKECVAEFDKATLTVSYTASEGITFNTIVDALAKFPDNEQNDMPVFMLAHRDDVAAIRKSLEDDLKFVEAYVRSGYIGTVCGVNIYTSDLMTAGSPVLATKEAVTYFNKKGVEMESYRDADHRYNELYSRKYGVFALTDARKAVKLVKGA